MFSVVVVYNNEKMMNRILMSSLKEQTAEYEFIPVDNTEGRLKSAAEALNYGGRKAKGKYLLFVHQDIELGSNTWLADTEKMLDSLPDLGIAGSVGMSTKGNTFDDGVVAYISNCGTIVGNPFEKPVEVQTLDECILIVPKSVFSRLQFDANTFDGWHSYGVDYCLSVQEMGLKVYVVPAFVYHRSFAINTKGLLKYEKRLYHKHKMHFPDIHAPTGRLTRFRVMAFPITGLLLALYAHLYYAKIIKKELGGCESVLDLGCGGNTLLQICNIPYSVGVDLCDSYLEESQKKDLHTKYIKADVRTVEFPTKSFDGILCSEVLEHLTKEEGQALLNKISLWAREKVIITTPNGYLPQGEFDNNPLQTHKSGWTVSELRSAGFKVIGMNGFRFPREPRGGAIKWKPTVLWFAISILTQWFAQYTPNLAFQLLAIKEIKDA